MKTLSLFNLKASSHKYATASDIPAELLDTKPSHSPKIEGWYEKGGSISIDDAGVWSYHDWEGNTVSYPGGYPDFKTARMVIQEAHIGPFVNRDADFKKARDLGYTKKPGTSWHHSEDGVTLQEIERFLHERFRHKGGISKMKKK